MPVRAASARVESTSTPGSKARSRAAALPTAETIDRVSAAHTTVSSPAGQDPGSASAARPSVRDHGPRLPRPGRQQPVRRAARRGDPGRPLSGAGPVGREAGRHRRGLPRTPPAPSRVRGEPAAERAPLDRRVGGAALGLRGAAAAAAGPPAGRARGARAALDHDGRPPRQLRAEPTRRLRRADLPAPVPLPLRLPHRRRSRRGDRRGGRARGPGDERAARGRRPRRLRDDRRAAPGEPGLGPAGRLALGQQQPVLLLRRLARRDGDARRRDPPGDRAHRPPGGAAGVELAVAPALGHRARAPRGHGRRAPLQPRPVRGRHGAAADDPRGPDVTAPGGRPEAHRGDVVGDQGRQPDVAARGDGLARRSPATCSPTAPSSRPATPSWSGSRDSASRVELRCAPSPARGARAGDAAPARVRPGEELGRAGDRDPHRRRPPARRGRRHRPAALDAVVHGARAPGAVRRPPAGPADRRELVPLRLRPSRPRPRRSTPISPTAGPT